jgi:hypothetical protein
MSVVKTLVVAVVAVIAAVLASVAVPGQTGPDQIPAGLLSALQSDADLKDLSWGSGPECLTVKKLVRASPFPLGQRQHVWLVEGRFPCLAGNDMWPMFLYIRTGTRWRKILYIDSGNSLNVCPHPDFPLCPVPGDTERRSARSQGWPDLVLTDKGGTPDETVYRFDGKMYKPVACRLLMDGTLTIGCSPDLDVAPGTRAEIPSSLLDTLQNDLTQFRKRARNYSMDDAYLDSRSCLERPLKEKIRAGWLNLDRRQRALLVEGGWPCLAGTNNGALLLYVPIGTGWRKIFAGLGQTLAVCAQVDPPCPVASGRERRSGGARDWPDLSLWQRAFTRRLILRFDGNAYKATLCNDVEYPVTEVYAKPRYSPCPADWKAGGTARGDLTRQGHTPTSHL